jgi:hypothetical protein
MRLEAIPPANINHVRADANSRLEPPVPLAEPSVLNGLEKMLSVHARACIEVGERSRHTKHGDHRTGRQGELLGCLFQEALVLR